MGTLLNVDQEQANKEERANDLSFIESLMTEIHSLSGQHKIFPTWYNKTKVSRAQWDASVDTKKIISELESMLAGIKELHQEQTVSSLLTNIFVSGIHPSSRVFTNQNALKTLHDDYYAELSQRIFAIEDFSILVDTFDAVYLNLLSKQKYKLVPEDKAVTSLILAKNSEFGSKYRGINGYTFVEYFIYSCVVFIFNLGTKKLRDQAFNLANDIPTMIAKDETDKLKALDVSDKDMSNIIKLGSTRLFDLKKEYPTSLAVRTLGKSAAWLKAMQDAGTGDVILESFEYEANREDKSNSINRIKTLLENKSNFEAFDHDGKIATFFLYEGNVCIHTSKKHGNYLFLSERFIKSINVKQKPTTEELQIKGCRNALPVTQKYFKQSHKSSFSNHYIDQSRYLDPLLSPFENNVSSGTRIDGQLVSLKTVFAKLGSNAEYYANQFKERKPVSSSRFDFSGYDGSVSLEENQHGDLSGFFAKEYKNTGNGYYYIQINDNYFVGYDID